MKILKTLLIILLVLVVIVGLLTAIAPTKLAVSRSTVINAPREVVWNNVTRFENINQWSPWMKLDPNMKVTLEGTDGAVGAKQSWVGNEQVGEGSQTISALDPMNRAESKIQFIKPWESEADAYVALADTTGGVLVTWGFTSTMPRPFNIFGLFMDMDEAIGKDYDKGLASLKEISEQNAAAAPSKTYRGYQIAEKNMAAKTYIGKKETVMFRDIGTFFGNNLPRIIADVQKAGLQTAGVPSGIYYTYDTVKMQTAMAAVVPVKEAASMVKPWETISINAGKALALDYYGAYDQSLVAYQAIDDYIDEAGLTPTAVVIEEFVTGPMQEQDTAKWLTKIYYYVK
jgi:effector-binding domain-containing protein/uncharacterized protein YndB with AHSA1/START domain